MKTLVALLMLTTAANAGNPLRRPDPSMAQSDAYCRAHRCDDDQIARVVKICQEKWTFQAFANCVATERANLEDTE
jgi:hypothetical protein